MTKCISPLRYGILAVRCGCLFCEHFLFLTVTKKNTKRCTFKYNYACICRQINDFVLLFLNFEPPASPHCRQRMGLNGSTLFWNTPKRESNTVTFFRFLLRYYFTHTNQPVFLSASLYSLRRYWALVLTRFLLSDLCFLEHHPRCKVESLLEPWRVLRESPW